MEEKNSIFRPKSITVLCYVVFFAGLITIVSIIWNWGSFSDTRHSYNLAIKAIGLVSIYGVYIMRRWGVYLYFGLFALNTVIFFLLPPSQQALATYTTPQSLAILVIVPAIVAIVLFRQWGKFR